MRASSPTRAKQRESVRQTEFSGRSTRQRCHAPETTRESSIPNRIRKTLHGPELPRAQNSERVVHSKQNSRDAPRTSTPARRKQREGSAAILKTHTAPQGERFGMHDPRRGFASEVENIESASTCTIPANSAPQRERFDTHETRRGVHPAHSRQSYPRVRNERK